MTQLAKIASLGLILFLAPTVAEAELSCDSLNRLSASLTSFRELQMDEARELSPDRLSALTVQLNALAADPLFPPATVQPAKDPAAVTVQQYLDNLQNAVRALRQGADRSVLDTVIPPAFGQAVAALQHSSRCPEPVPPTELGLGLALDGQPARVREDPPARPSPRPASARLELGGSPAGGRHVSALATSAAVGPVQQGSLWLMMLGVAALASGVIAFASHHNTRQHRQRSDRHFVQLNTTVLLGKSAVPMTIVDIAPAGVKLRHHGQIRNRRKLRILLLDGWRSGKIRWHNDHFAGVSFSQYLSSSELNALVESTRTVAGAASGSASTGGRKTFAAANRTA